MKAFQPYFLGENSNKRWAASSEFGTYRLCEQRRFRRACASVQSRQNLRCSIIQAASQEEPSNRKPDLWTLSMAGHAQLKFVMTECSKTQIRLTGPRWFKWLLVDVNPWFRTLIKYFDLLVLYYNWALSRQNVSSGLSDQARHKPACAATEAS